MFVIRDTKIEAVGSPRIKKKNKTTQSLPNSGLLTWLWLQHILGAALGICGQARPLLQGEAIPFLQPQAHCTGRRVHEVVDGAVLELRQQGDDKLYKQVVRAL